MKLATPGGSAHLTYCTNIHRGERWAEVDRALRTHLPAIKAAVAPDQALGVGLRLSAIAADELAAPDAFDAFRAFLAEHRLYVFTLNGFPYGPFHGVRVKEHVYQPDWRTGERLRYTNQLADLLLRLLPEEPGLDGSISTVPGTFRPLGAEPGALNAIAANLLEHVAHLVGIERRTGRTIRVALEPEPMCLLETTEEAAAFLEDHLLAAGALARLAERLGVGRAAAEVALRRHCGVCLDVCHAAVEFEEPAHSVARLERAGIAIPKLQLSSALRVPVVRAEDADALRAFDDGVYLHQVVERHDGRLVRYLDLPDALATLPARAGAEWRIHCHVPVFAAEAGRFATTQDTLAAFLELQRARTLSAHLEVETYTFEVLPEALRAGGMTAAIARELVWARDRLVA
jgi:hypothetical protein